jgi:hypothetical protein
MMYVRELERCSHGHDILVGACSLVGKQGKAIHRGRPLVYAPHSESERVHR